MWQFPHYGPESLTIIYRIARHFCGGENFACQSVPSCWKSDGIAQGNGPYARA